MGPMGVDDGEGKDEVGWEAGSRVVRDEGGEVVADERWSRISSRQRTCHAIMASAPAPMGFESSEQARWFSLRL